MKKIQMVDLKGQYQEIKDKVDSSIQSVIDSASFINGPKVKEFQLNLENYLNIKHVIPCANGTDALQIAMMGLGLKAGDEVITQCFNFIAVVEAIVDIGAKPIITEINQSLNMCPIDLERKITIFHAEIIKKLNLSNDTIIGFHGQNIYHNPEEKISKQLGNGKLLNQLTK